MMRLLIPLATVVLLASLAACAGSQPQATSTPTLVRAGEATSTPAIAPATTAAPAATTEEQPQVVVETELPFATYNDTTLTLDLYVPADPAGAPIVIEPWERFAYRIAQEGAIAVIERTGIPDGPDTGDGEPPLWNDHGALIRAQAEATACKIGFARARASELGSDDPIVVKGGFSAGAGLSAHVALFGDALEERWDEFAATVGGPDRQVECVVAERSTRVDALVGGSGAYDAYVPVIEGLYGRTYQRERDPELQEFLASAVGIDPELTVRLIHGTADPAIPTTVSVDFEAVLADAGYDVQLITFEGGHHDPPTELSLRVFKEVLGL